MGIKKGKVKEKLFSEDLANLTLRAVRDIADSELFGNPSEVSMEQEPEVYNATPKNKRNRCAQDKYSNHLPVIIVLKNINVNAVKKERKCPTTKS